MKVVFLDGEKLSGFQEVCAAFAEAVPFPEEFGNNLDALHDVLTESCEPLGVIAVNAEELKKSLGRRAKGFWRLMNDLAEEREGFWFEEPFKF